MHEEYLPKTEEGKLDHIEEELFEALLVFKKLKRFGPFSYHPNDEDKKTNLDLLESEIKDVVLAFDSYRKHVI